MLALDPLCPLDHDDWKLAHLSQEPVTTYLLRDTRHDDLVTDGADKESDESSHRPTDVRTRGAVNVTTEEVVYWDIPLATKFQPIGGVPPV